MSDEQRPQGVASRNSDRLIRQAGSREESAKSTPSTDRVTETSSGPAVTSTPRTPFSPSNQSPSQPQFRVPPSPRAGGSGMADGEHSAKSAKVAIPRLKRSIESGDGGNKPGGRHRVTHACEPCRHRKTKCSGERPTCRHCQDFKIQCYYADGKRDRVKKQFGSMQDKVADYEKVLQDLISRVSDEDAEMIRATLERLDSEDAVLETVTLPSVEADAIEVEPSGAESDASGGRGSTGALDKTEEDFTREGAKSTGFMGKNSEITWLQRLRQENRYGEGTSPDSANARRLHEISGSSLGAAGAKDPTDPTLPEADTGFTIQESSYHLNDLSISTYEAVDPYEMPTSEHAQALFMTFLNRVHPMFPIIGRVNLQNQFAKFLARPITRPPPKWLAIINMIFAISAKYSHLIQADWQADERDHLIYFTRARMLSIDSDTLFVHSDLQMIQILALMSYYLMAIDQINRSWNLAGLAMRQATALGLNMRNESVDLSNGLKEIRYRVWWALYVHEHRLCAMTGRVNCIADEHCTAPLPVPINEEDFETEMGIRLLNTEQQRTARAPSSNVHTPSAAGSTPSSRSGSGPQASQSPSAPNTSSTHGDLDWTKDVQPGPSLFFLHVVQLARLTQAIFNNLYCPTAVQGKWSDIQSTIASYDQQLENWYRALPAIFDFRRKQRDREHYEARLALGFFYYATKQMLHRPCLCRLDRKIPGQSQKSQEFNRSAAMACVIAAQEQLALIPDEPNAVGLLRVGPWVSILHMLVQSSTVMMLEISFRAHHMPQQVDDIVESAKKAVRWLHALGDENLAAARAWQISHDMLQLATAKIGRNVDDMPNKPPRAVGSSSDDTNMSGATIIQQPSVGRAANESMHPMQLSNIGMPSVYAHGPTFDPFVRYDQYYTMDSNLDPAQMSFASNQPHMPFEGHPEDNEMNFMNHFTEQQDESGSRGARGSRSGFG